MEKINFEKSLSRLETINSELETGDVSLDEMIKLYTEGIELVAECSKALENVRLKITKISEESLND